MGNLQYRDSPVGRIGIAEDGGAVTHLFFENEPAPEGFALAETPLLRRAATQLSEYFEGARTAFELPLAPRGTEFQLSVWGALREIPWGETRSYKDIAARVGKPRAYRAVGMANNRNPIAIIIPCHRVIGAGGDLVGYGGGLSTKRFLLELERRRA
ncbi:MAG: methylated-DNA--[protein]-cysteine S-methyltransferase [Clostridiales Family XIII bacterium]|jgi:methylated-DNA-[protein]-cysteine S-methyltransferase|nr:methylated-DNA--[protein]-cysteine S-methyltransferase [Clostridiales Family XIII bacterium]